MSKNNYGGTMKTINILVFIIGMFFSIITYSDVVLYDLNMFKKNYIGEQGNLNKNFKILKDLEEQALLGDPEMQYEMSKIFINGEFIKKDSISREIWLKKSADGDFSNAQYELANLLLERGDVDLALFYFLKCANQGDIRAIKKITYLYRESLDYIAKNTAEAITLYGSENRPLI